MSTENQQTTEKLRQILTPDLLMAVYNTKFPHPKTQQPNGAEIGHFQFRPSPEYLQSFYDLIFHRAIKPMSQIPLDVLLKVDLTELLPDPDEKDYPEKALGLVVLIDQSRILTSGYGQRYTRVFFDSIAEKLASQVIALPQVKRPDGHFAWTSRGYWWDEWITRALWFWGPLVHSDSFMIKHRQVVKDWLHSMRAEVEAFSRMADPFRELEAADDLDLTAFERIFLEGPPQRSLVSPDKEASASDYAFWWIRVLNAHFAITDICGRYPYNTRWKGLELTEKDNEFLRNTTVFRYKPEDEEILQQVRKDHLEGVWQPLPNNPEFEKSSEPR